MQRGCRQRAFVTITRDHPPALSRSPARFVTIARHRWASPSRLSPQFGINLSTLVECLRIFSGNATSGALHLRYMASTACLSLTLVEG